MTFFFFKYFSLFYGNSFKTRFKTIQLNAFDASPQLVGASHVILNFCTFGVCIICDQAPVIFMNVLGHSAQVTVKPMYNQKVVKYFEKCGSKRVASAVSCTPLYHPRWTLSQHSPDIGIYNFITGSYWGRYLHLMVQLMLILLYMAGGLVSHPYVQKSNCKINASHISAFS